MSVTSFFGSALGEQETQLLAQLGEDISSVEAELTKQLASQVELVENVGLHTLEAGGKRLRPAFVSLSAKATGLTYDPKRARKLGACMEMIHMATLIHDDVIDHSSTRRGRETASALFGATGSILSGDVLLAKAMAILAIDGDLEIIRNVAQSVVEMAEGEVRELQGRHNFDLDESEHLEVLRMKTAAFIQSCCEVGALIAGAPDEHRFALRDYGYHIGMAFQIVDDLLDYRSESTGKPKAKDFHEGCATLPLIYLRPELAEHECEVARRKFGNGVSDDEMLMICDWMRDRGAFEQASNLAREHVTQALSALCALPETPARTLLELAANFVLSRDA